MALARHNIQYIYKHINTHYTNTQINQHTLFKARKSSPTSLLQNCPERTSMKEIFITPVLELQKSPNLDQSFLISWARYV